MANEMIALQARAPDMPSFMDYVQIRDQAQNRQNAMVQMQQQQNAMLRKQAEEGAMNNAYGQAYDPATGRIDANKLGGLLAQGGFGSAIPGAQQELSKAQGEQSKSSQEQLKYLLAVNTAVRDQLGNANTPEDALARAQALVQSFPDIAPHMQQSLSTMPKDPAGFAQWKQDQLRENLSAEQQLKQHFFKIEDATGQHILSVPEVGGAARIVEGSRTSSAPKTQFVWGANGGQVIDTSKPGPVMDGGGGPASVDSLLPAIVQQESRGNYGAVNSSTGAMGAYQVMPATGKSLADQLGLPWRPDLMTSPSPAGRQYQDQIGKAAVAEAVAASGGDVGTAAAYYHGGSDRAKWGPKTRQYAQEVAARVGGGGQLQQAPTAAEKTAQAKAAKSEAYSQSAIDAFDRAIASGENLLKHPGFAAAVGSGFDPAAIGSYNPFTGESFAGSEAANFETDLDTMKSQVFLPMVQSMKGMGALSNAEGEKLTAAIGNLNAKQSEASFKKNMSQILSDLKKYSARSRSGGAQPAQPAQAATPPAANSGWGTAKVVGGR